MRRLYGTTSAAEFTPKKLKAVREAMIVHEITREAADRIPILADGAMRDGPAAGWYDVGRGLGAFLAAGPLAGAGGEATPFAPIAGALLRLPRRDRRASREAVSPNDERPRWPLLRRFEEAAGGSEAALRASLPGAWTADNLDTSGQNLTLEFEAKGLAAELEVYLLTGAGAHKTPRWDRTAGEPYFGEDLIRRVDKRGVNIIQVLDAFEERGWPDEIKDPTKHAAVTKKETIDSLNDNMLVQRIKFVRRGPLCNGWEGVP